MSRFLLCRVYSQDQGFYLGEHGWFDKRFMYEESMHMPLLIRYPNMIQPGLVSDEMVLNIDFAPTLLDLAGVKAPKIFQGKSFYDLLKNESNTTFRDAVYYHYFEFPYWHHVQPHYGIRTNKFKLIHFYYSLNEWEFFDLENDPNELNNLIENPAYEEVIKNLKVRLDELKKEYKMDLSTDELRKMTDIRINRRYRVEPAN